jgi:hypothetical protein
MSGEAAATAVEAAPAAEATTTEDATTESTEATTEATEKPAFDPAKRNFKAEMAARIAERQKAAGESVEMDPPAVEAKTEPEAPPEKKPPPKNTGKPPKNRLGDLRKAHFERLNAEKAAQQANSQVQTEAQKVAQLQSELEAARGFENQYKSLIREGKFDEAINLSGELDGVEALQRRILERENLVPKNDPAVSEMKAELEALKRQVEARETQEAEVREQARQQAEHEAWLEAVKDTSLNHENENVRKWAELPGFNEQVLAAVRQFPHATEDQIYGKIVEGFEDLAASVFKIHGIDPNTARTSAKSEAAPAATPARSSVKTEAASAVKPERKPLVSVPTNAAESSKPEPFDPMSKSEKKRFSEFMERQFGRR